VPDENNDEASRIPDRAVGDDSDKEARPETEWWRVVDGKSEAGKWKHKGQPT
jgi:hypothetical protein